MSLENSNNRNSNNDNNPIYKIQFLTNKDAAEKISISNILVFRGNIDKNTDKMSQNLQKKKKKYIRI